MKILRKRCDRCGDILTAWSTGYFTTQELCLTCIEEEQEAPGYQAARTAEENAVRQGNLNFPGVGLSPEDSAFLAQKRAERNTK